MPTLQKEQQVASISERLAKSQSLYLSNFSGMTVNELQDMRRKLREVDAEFRVVKNTLLKIALKGTPYEKLGENLEYSTGVTFGYGDPAAPARVLNETLKSVKKNEVKAIGYENQVYSDPEFLKRLADLPTREVMLQIVLGTMMAPIAGFARVVNAIREKLEQEGGATAEESAEADAKTNTEESGEAPQAAAESSEDDAPAGEEKPQEEADGDADQEKSE